MVAIDDRLKRLEGFYETGAIGLYDADDLHSDMQWLYHAYQELRGALAVVATYEATRDPDPWQDVSARASLAAGFRTLARKTLDQIDAYDPDEK